MMQEHDSPKDFCGICVTYTATYTETRLVCGKGNP